MKKTVEKALKDVREIGYDLPQEVVDRYVALAIKEESPELAYELSCLVDMVPLAKRRELEKVVIRSRNSEYNYLYARDIPNASIKHHEKVIILNKDLFYVCEFACDVPGANINKLQQLILDAKDAKFAYLFANNVDGANIDALQQIVIDSKDEVFIKKFMNDIEESSKKKLGLALGRAIRSSKSKSKDEGISR